MSFRFAHPWWLLTLLLIPLWVWVGQSRRFRRPLHYPSAAQLRTLPVSWARLLAPLPPVMITLSMILLLVALARPQTGLQERRVSADTLDIILAIDTSTSMRAIDLVEDRSREQNRLDAVKEVAATFIDSREGDRIGLIAFAEMPYTISPLTLDRAWLQTQLEELKTGTLPDGTAVGSALASAVNRLRDSETASKIVVLLTDGISNSGDIEPLNAAPLAEALGIRVYTIGAGSSGRVRIPVTDMFGRSVMRQVHIPIDEETLARIAEITGGRYFRAENRNQLEEVFQEIDELERTEVELTEYTLYTEQFPWIVASGLALLGTARLLAAGRLGRVSA
jgi:Ca-activated chloride channel family protein